MLSYIWELWFLRGYRHKPYLYIYYITVIFKELKDGGRRDLFKHSRAVNLALFIKALVP